MEEESGNYIEKQRALFNEILLDLRKKREKAGLVALSEGEEGAFVYRLIEFVKIVIGK